MLRRRALTTIVSLTIIAAVAYVSIYLKSPLPLFYLSAFVLLASFTESISFIEDRSISKVFVLFAILSSFYSIAFLISTPKFSTHEVFLHIPAKAIIFLGLALIFFFASSAFTWKKINFRTAAADNGVIFINFVFYGVLAPLIFRILLDLNYLVLPLPEISETCAGIYFFLGSILTAKMADIGAFLGGFFFGKKLFRGKKMAPRISPKKTVAGLIFGLLTSGVFGYCLLHFNPFGKFHISIILSFGLVVGLFSVGGDLFQSMLKRSFNRKDSGTFLPGIGGWFDLTDSLFWAGPIAYALLVLNYYILQ